VHHRRADAGALRRDPPVPELENVHRPEQPLDRRTAETAPGCPDGVGGGHRPETQIVERDSVEGSADPARPFEARRREADELVAAGSDLGQPGERAPDVVPNAGPRVGERADVDRDPQFSSFGGKLWWE
jgi:hypothetical protein